MGYFVPGCEQQALDCEMQTNKAMDLRNPLQVTAQLEINTTMDLGCHIEISLRAAYLMSMTSMLSQAQGIRGNVMSTLIRLRVVCTGEICIRTGAMLRFARARVCVCVCLFVCIPNVAMERCVCHNVAMLSCVCPQRCHAQKCEYMCEYVYEYVCVCVLYVCACVVCVRVCSQNCNAQMCVKT